MTLNSTFATPTSLKAAAVGGFCILMLTCGCSSESPPAVAGSNANPQSDGSTAVPDSSDDTTSPGKPAREFRPLTFSGAGSESADDSKTADPSAMTADQKVEQIIGKLKPIQILLGQWRGTTRRQFGEFKAVDSHEWLWDLQSSPEEPALVIASDKSPYLHSGRLTWDIAAQQFVLVGEDLDGTARTFRGDFTEKPHEVMGDDDKPQKVFRLELEQDEADDAGEQWQLAITQQENNRYLLEVGRRRGNAAFSRHDTVSTQRDGTSFALSDSDYAERTCIISEGLGTTELKYKGRSYWVCCSGCKAAFEEDPATWIARAAERQKKAAQSN